MSDLVGQTILHYKIIKKLGEGGMGVVYLAEDTRLERKVAIKFLPYHISGNSEERERFKIEAKAAASLNHPNIATIYAIEESNNEMFIVMEYIEGKELKEIVEAENFQPLQMNDVINYAIQIAEGLEAAHKKGIIHRDIKSQNIMITNDGKVKIMDFGLAKIKGGSELTKMGTTIGTISYMSPEQAKGEEVDNRTDIWSFGVVLYEMLTGELPFTGDYDQAIIYSILNEETLSNNVTTEFDDPLNFTANKCLKKNKDERFSSFGEILSKLNPIRNKSVIIEKNNYGEKETFSFQNTIPQKSNLFIGRKNQVDLIKKLFERIKTNKGKTLLICGEPGIGKTQFISYSIKNYTDLNFNVLYGRCLFNNEGGLPYHPFINAIKSNPVYDDNIFLNFISNNAYKNNIDISKRIPLIRTFLNQTNEFSKTLLHKEQMWDTILILFKTISLEKPLILILDDIQWADKATLDLISFIARNILQFPILLIGVYRPPEIVVNFDTKNLVETIRQLRLEDLAEKIDIERLSFEETGELLKKLFDNKNFDKKIKDKIFHQSEGNPLFVFELTNLMKDKGLIKFEKERWKLINNGNYELVSEKVQDVIKQRVENLDSKTKEILQIASCEGEYFQSDILSGCLDINRIELLKLLQSLEFNNGIIHNENKFYRFDHILIREVLYDSIIPELKEEYHKIIADWLIQKYKDTDEFASRIAHHLISSGEENRAVNYLLKAANKARDLYAIEEALSYYQKVLETIKKFKIDNVELTHSAYEGMGDTSISLGKLDEAIDHYKQYYNLALSKNLKFELVRSLRKLAECYRVKGEIDTAEKYCNDALKFANDLNDKKELLESINTLALINASRGDYKKTVELSTEVLKLSNENNDLKSKSTSLSDLGFAYWHLGNYRSSEEKFIDAITIQRSIGDNKGLSTTLNFLGLANWKLGKYQEALNNSLESIDIKKSIADFRKIPGSINVVGDVYREIGDIKKAIKNHQKSLMLSTEHQNKGAMCDNIRDLGEDYFLIEDLGKALSYYQKVLELAKTAGLKWYETRTYISLAELYLYQEKVNKAKENIEIGLKYSFELGAKDLIIEALWKDASIKFYEDLLDESLIKYEESIKISKEVGHKTFLWKLFFDMSGILKKQNKIEDAKTSIAASKKIVQEIIDNLKDGQLRTTYMNSKKVKELLKVRA